MAKKAYFTTGPHATPVLDTGAPGNYIISTNSKRSYPLLEALGQEPMPPYLGYLHLAERIESTKFMQPAQEHGLWMFRYGEDMLFNRIWVEPLLISAGFITEETIHEIEIWNAYLDRDVLWTSVVVIRQPGTDFDYPTLPFEITKTADIVRDITVFKDGPPLQDTYYQMTIDGVLFVIYISGIRIVPLEPEPNWESGIKNEYEFQTVMFNTEYFREQRRALQDKSNRKIGFTFNLDELENHRFFNRISYGHDKIFGVPIFSEKMYPTLATQGTSVITTSNSNEFLWNMQNRTQFVILANHTDRVLEIKEILNFTDYQINLKSVIVESFDLTKTVVYPCLFGTVSAVKYNEKTTHVQTADVEFKEFIASG